MKYFTLVLIALITISCTPRPAPTTPDTITADADARGLPNRIINGPLPGCGDAFELVDQTLMIPQQEITLDVENIVDRVGVVVRGATYSYATRPVNPFNCDSTTLPAIPMPSVAFGFNYLGDYTRRNPLCMNASSITFTGFSITGTALDSLVEGVVRDLIWLEVDCSVAGTFHSLHNGGAFPGTANPRCSNWVDLTTL